VGERAMLMDELRRTLRTSRPSATGHARSAHPREIEILRLVAEGLSNHEIAVRLVLSDETVKTHVSHVLRQLGLRHPG
jgi:DNA-binding NarL/FixJ family response regulator